MPDPRARLQPGGRPRFVRPARRSGRRKSLGLPPAPPILSATRTVPLLAQMGRLVDRNALGQIHRRPDIAVVQDRSALRCRLVDHIARWGTINQLGVPGPELFQQLSGTLVAQDDRIAGSVVLELTVGP